MAFLRMSALTLGSLATVGSIGEGTVAKGLGVGGKARVSWPIALPTTFDPEDPWTACPVGGLTLPIGLPALPDAGPAEDPPARGPSRSEHPPARPPVIQRWP
ncbi:hypothetical protein K2Z84_20335 [Candidatus Binatia bacterium]|nr:hypothetical protein [Candidatus Binatia bacterium]